MNIFKQSIIFLAIAFALNACSDFEKSSESPTEPTDSHSSTLPESTYSPENQVNESVETESAVPAQEEAEEKSAAGQQRKMEAANTVARAPSALNTPPAIAGQLPPEPTNNQQALNSAMFSKEVLARKFVFNAGMRFRVKDVYQSAIEIENMVYATGGFVLKNDIRSDTISTQNFPQSDNTLLQISRYQRTGELVVRVPTHQTQEFLRKLSSQIDSLDVREFVARDVQFDALRQQLAYQRTQETQQSLGQAINQVRSDTKIDAIYGQDRMKNIRDDARVTQAVFEDQVAYSTIRLSIYQPEQLRQDKVVDVDAILKANEPSFSERLENALKSGWGMLLSGVIVLASGWWFWLGLLIVSAFIWKKRRNITRTLNKQDTKTALPEQIKEPAENEKQKPDETD